MDHARYNCMINKLFKFTHMINNCEKNSLIKNVCSSYRNTLKFVLIFGVATTLHIVHRSLTYDVTSKLVVQAS